MQECIELLEQRFGANSGLMIVVREAVHNLIPAISYSVDPSIPLFGWEKVMMAIPFASRLWLAVANLHRVDVIPERVPPLQL
jgi:hypothetical protein